MTQSIGVIGLGEIGRGLMKALAPTDFELAVHDVRSEAMDAFADRATLCPDPATVGSLSDVVLIAVVNDSQVLEVLEGAEGALAKMDPGSTVIVISTISVDTLTRVADTAAARTVGVVDCGVSGGPAAAAEVKWVSMVGGTDEAFEAARPVLDVFSSLVVRMGPLGSGMRAKLARQVVQFGSWLAAYEGQRIAEAAGIDLARLAEVVRESDSRIGGATTLMFRLTVAPFAADDDQGLVAAMRNAAALAHKDLAAAKALATQLGLEVPVVDLTEEQIDRVFGVAP